MKLSWRKLLVMVGVIGLLAGVIILTGCSGDKTETADTGDSAGDCAACHDDTTLVSGKQNQYALTTHITGRGWHYAGPRASCTNCHSHEGFTDMIAMGKTVEEGVDRADASPPDCRTCHQIHTTYTEADWALTTTAPVTLLASGQTYDGGKGNLCANCHQPRREMEAENGIVNVNSTHWGPHHGPQATMLLGIGGAGVTGKPSAHYNMVEDTCATCHVGNDNHLFSPSMNSYAINTCTDCHADASNFDIGGLQTEVEELIVELTVLLSQKHMIETASHEPYHAGDPLEDLHPVVGEYPEEEAAALWNWILIQIEDSSSGVHNPSYTKALLEYSIEALQ